MCTQVGAAIVAVVAGGPPPPPGAGCLLDRPFPFYAPLPMSLAAVEVGDKLVICLASTLNLDGTPSASTFDAVGAAGGGRGGGGALLLAAGSAVVGTAGRAQRVHKSAVVLSPAAGRPVVTQC